MVSVYLLQHILTFFLHSLKHPVAIYCDFETVNRKLPGCEPDPTSSFTNKKTIHEASGFSYTVTSPFFPNREKTYRHNLHFFNFLAKNIFKAQDIVV